MIKRLAACLQSSPLWWGQCLLCRHDCEQQTLICRQCRDELPQLARPCTRCGFPLAVEDAHCGQCQRRPPPWQRMQVLADFAPPYSDLIHQLKYHRKPLHGRLLGQLLAAAVSPPLPEVILPVPLHWWRKLRRGYNQAEEIARGVQQVLGITVDPGALQRVRMTASQTRLSRRQRRLNLHRAFVARPRDYRHVALLDDVITTGTTMAELTHLLHRQGVESVEVWAPCRTLEH
ncbi:amidophosphoribosyltransferase [Zobellella endophytica]|uniref:Amidophosphoribosyltransferase n=1 Tax=Zobellella endophytica TaxID=2116700 RepID=A0A2P7R2I0_9GAMM|nr:ComF family protein [Zobellella endophytica]PSJ44423.1 amidophosphoribosyltransferase [Zobellella endophytica]